MSQKNLAVLVMLNENTCVWDQKLNELINPSHSFVNLSGWDSKETALQMVFGVLSFYGRLLCDIHSVPKPYIFTWGVCFPGHVAGSEDITVCHQTVPVVPSHLAEDGIELLALSSLYLAWTNLSSSHPSAGRLFPSPSGSFKLQSLSGQAGKWLFPQER